MKLKILFCLWSELVGAQQALLLPFSNSTKELLLTKIAAIKINLHNISFLNHNLYISYVDDLSQCLQGQSYIFLTTSITLIRKSGTAVHSKSRAIFNPPRR